MNVKANQIGRSSIIEVSFPNDEIVKHKAAAATFGVALALLLLSAPVVHAASFDVDSPNDVGDTDVNDGKCIGGTRRNGTTYCTLRAAIEQSNWKTDQDTIYLVNRTYTVRNELKVTSPIDIFGWGAGTTFIERPCPKRNSGGECYGLPADIPEFSIFTVSAEGYLGLWSLQVRNGLYGWGGGILNRGSVEVRGSTIAGNHAHLYGGGIYNEGWLYLQDSTVTNNFTHRNGFSRGGGIYSYKGIVDIAYSTINNNKTEGGGGLYIYAGGLNMWNSTVSGNTSFGGRLSEPSAGGLIIAESGEAWLKNVTVTANTSRGGSKRSGVANQGRFYFTNTLIAGGTEQDQDCSGQLISLGGNLVGARGYKNSEGTYPCGIVGYTPWPANWPDKAADQIGDYLRYPDPGELPRIDPLLGPLADNGGTTCTHALMPGSPAIDKAWAGVNGQPDGFVLSPEPYDQRWYKRVDGLGDVGAFEAVGTPKPAGLGCL